MISNILFKSVKNRPLNILDTCGHERYQNYYSKVNHNFYIYTGCPGVKRWDVRYAPIPKNFTILDGTKFNQQNILSQIPIDLEIDCVVSHSRFCHYPLFSVLAKHLGVPLVTVEHTIPPPGANQRYVDAVKNNVGDINIYITHGSIPKWGHEPNEKHTIIYHGVDSVFFCPPENNIRINDFLSVMNAVRSRAPEMGWEFWLKTQELLNGQIKLVGSDNEPYGKCASNVDELKAIYQSSKCMINTTLTSTIPYSLLEAMSCGCVPVTLNTGCINEFIEDKVNGIFVSSPEEAATVAQDLIKNPDLMTYLGENARKTILEKCNLGRFVSEWNQVWDRVRCL